MEKYKIELLKRSYKKNLKTFVRHLGQMLKDKFFGPTFLIFHIHQQELTSENIAVIDGLNIQTYYNWEQIDENLRNTIENEYKQEYWGKPEWFDLGWQLCIGNIDNYPVALSWTRIGSQCNDFVMPLTEKSAILWQTVILPSARGQGIFSVILYRVSKQLFERGIESIYGLCREYNYPSKKSTMKIGFKIIGFLKIKKKLGKSAYYPNYKLFNLG